MRTLLSTVAAVLCFIGAAAKSPAAGPAQATFSYFRYTGKDACFDRQLDPANQYFNPILAGFYPDPSICRKGDDYYLVCSSFSYYPGIPIFHSRDMVNWTQLGHVLDHPSQLELGGVRLSGGIYAPDIKYCPRDDTFYLVNTCVGGIGNFIVTTKDPAKGWSDPVRLPEVGGIDASIFFDDDGRTYILNNDAPDGKPEWDGHRAIWMREYDTQAGNTIGRQWVVVDGGADKSKKPIWIEAPHLYKIDGRYYLMCAEGGTAEQHSEVIFRSDSVRGPYVPWEGNPILTQRDLPEDRSDPVTCAGHADLVQTPAGDWWAVFLACRPYGENCYNTGRETFMLPVEWRGGWPVILDHGTAMPRVVEKHGLAPSSSTLTDNFTSRDDFNSGGSLRPEWIFLRSDGGGWWRAGRGGLTLSATGCSIYDVGTPAYVARRQQHACFEAQTEMRFDPKVQGDMAGVALFQNETHNFVFAKTLDAEGNLCIVVDRAAGEAVDRIAKTPLPTAYAHKPLVLRIVGEAGLCSFYVSLDAGRSWISVCENADATQLSTRRAGGFIGVTMGPYVDGGH